MASAEVVLAQLRAAYSFAWNPSAEIVVEATKFEPVRLVGNGEEEAKHFDRCGSPPKLVTEPYRCTTFIRGWMSATKFRRIEDSPTNVLSGPEDARWGVRVLGEQFAFRSPTKKAPMVELGVRTSTFDWEGFDLLAEDDLIFPGFLAHQFYEYLSSLPPNELRVERDDTTTSLLLDRRRLRLTLDTRSGEIRMARMAFVLQPEQDGVCEYEGSAASNIYPAPQPAAIYRARVPANAKMQRDQTAIRVDLAARTEAGDRSRFTWQSVGEKAVRLDTKEVLSRDGSVDIESTERIRRQKPRESPIAEMMLGAVEKRNHAWAWSLAAAGILLVGTGIFFRLRRRNV